MDESQGFSMEPVPPAPIGLVTFGKVSVWRKAIRGMRKVPLGGVVVLGMMGLMLPGLILLTKQQTNIQGKAAGITPTPTPTVIPVKSPAPR